MPDARVDRLEAALNRLADAQGKTEGELRALAEAQRRTEERLEALAARVDQLAEAQRRTEERLEALIARVDQLAEALQLLTRHVDHLTDVVAGLKGDVLEQRYREKAAGYFQRILSGIRLVVRDDLERLATEAEARGVLSFSEHADLLLSDVIVRGRLRDRPDDAYLVVEVSSVLDSRDVERARRRAELLKRVVGLPVVAAVAGEHLTPQADQEAARLRIWRVVDGQVIPPE